MHILEENKVKNLADSKKILLVHNYYKIPGGEDTVVETADGEISLLYAA